MFKKCLGDNDCLKGQQCIRAEEHVNILLVVVVVVEVIKNNKKN
jgi:hypothetical protein